MQRSLLAARPQVLHRAVLRPATAVLSRGISTQTLTIEENLEALNKKRNLRPESPWHIYQPQLTSVSSLANRATGVGLSAGMYALFLAHLAGLDSATLVSLFADLPEWAKLSAKSLVAYPAVYHTINGLRHLSWDSGKLLSLKSSYNAGYAVLAASFISGTGLVFFL